MGTGRQIMSMEDGQDLEHTKKVIKNAASSCCLLSSNNKNNNNDDDDNNNNNKGDWDNLKVV